MARWAFKGIIYPPLAFIVGCSLSMLPSVVPSTRMWMPRPPTIKHSKRELPRDTLIHSIHIEEGSKMEEIFGTREVAGGSPHHQAVKEPGRGVHISGRAEDDIARLFEVPEKHFVVAAQGHPEEISAML